MAVPLSEPWTIEQLDRLPDDSNRYELLEGDLLVTPPPSEVHETLVAWLNALLVPFVQANGLGFVFHPRAVMQVAGARLEPDLMVRANAPIRGWPNAPIPILVVEVLSRSTRDRDFGRKRDFYTTVGVAEYWIVDHENAVVVQVRGGEEHMVSSVLRWSPPGTTVTLEIDVEQMFTTIRARLA